MEGITVFTPTYNREKYLKILYKSLLKQTFQKFEWLIVDDGSTDVTKITVEEFQRENKIDIKYIYQENSGKHVAFNTGVANSKYDLFMCIDSDDYLVDDILSHIYFEWNKIKDVKENLCGILANRGKSKNETMFGEKFINPYTFSTVREEMKRSIFETTMIHKTEILKLFPFPKFQGENFITEDVVWRKIDQDYVYYVIPEVWTICSYLDNGLTRTTNIFRYPKGEAEYYKVRYISETKIINKLKEYGRYLVFDKKRLPGRCGTILYLPAILMSRIYLFVWKKRFK